MPRNAHGADGGFSIVEMVIAMFLLTVLALAILPLLIGAVRASSTNRAIVSATAFANAQLAPIRAAFPNTPTGANTCTAVRSKAATGIAGPTGSSLKADITVGSCPAAFPGTVMVTVSVYGSATPGTILASLPTKILVTQ